MIVDAKVPELYDEMIAAAGDRNLWVVGGGDVASQFADEGLLDDVLVTVVPVVLGEGKPLFDRCVPGGPMQLRHDHLRQRDGRAALRDQAVATSWRGRPPALSRVEQLVAVRSQPDAREPPVRCVRAIERAVPDDRVNGTPASAARGDPTDGFSREVLGVEAALSDDGRVRAVEPPVEIERVEDEPGAGGAARAERGPQPARKPARGARQPHPGVARELGRQPLEPRREPPDRIRGRAFCGPYTWAASSNAVSTSHSTGEAALPEAAGRADGLDRTRAAVDGRAPAGRHEDAARASSRAATISSPVPLSSLARGRASRGEQRRPMPPRPRRLRRAGEPKRRLDRASERIGRGAAR